MFLDLVLASPMERMMRSTRVGVVLDIASASGNLAKRDGDIELTFLSVHCAESTAHTRSWNGVRCSKGQSKSPYSVLRASWIKGILAVALDIPLGMV